MFAKCVLRQQPEVRGGRKKKLRRNETLSAAQVTRWNEGKVDELWSEARTLYPGGDRRANLLRLLATFAGYRVCSRCSVRQGGGCSAFTWHVSYERRYAQGDAS